MSAHWKHYVAWLLPCVLLLLVLERAVRRETHERNYEVFTEMVYSRAYETLSASPELPGGLTQQPVQPGVVVRGLQPFHFGPGPEEALRAGRELRNPYEDEPEGLARGALLFSRFCTVCHGGDGEGLGPVVQRGMLPPPSLHAARAMQMADGEMFHVVTMGQGNMGSHAAQIAAEDRWKIVRHIRSLQGGAR